MEEEEGEKMFSFLKKNFIILTDYENDYSISLNKHTIVAFHKSKIKENMTVVYTNVHGRIFEVKESVEEVKRLL